MGCSRISEPNPARTGRTAGGRADSGQLAALDAPALAQGGGLQLAVGAERHLPHEAIPFVQQRQGQSAPTRQLKEGAGVINDGRLVHEAAAMGAPALPMGPKTAQQRLNGADASVPAGSTVQRLLNDQANVVLDPPTDKTPEALRNEINANLAVTV